MITDSILAPVAALSLPDGAQLAGRAESALSFIQTLEVTDALTYDLAADELRAIKTKANRLEEQRTAITGPMNQALKAINNLFRAPAEFLARGEQILKTKMLAYDHEQQRLADEERRKAEAAAAAERRRLDDEAAARQREADAQIEAARAAAAKGDEQAAQQATAAAERAQAEAQTASMTSQMVVAPVIQAERPKSAGISTSVKVEFEVISLHQLVMHIAEHPELLALLRADDVKLRAYVKGLGTACALPGVRVFEGRVMSARAAA